MEKIQTGAPTHCSLSVPVRTKGRVMIVSLQSSSPEKRQRSALPKATMIHEPTSDIAAKTKGLAFSTSNKALDHEAMIKCRFAGIISKSQQSICDNGNKKTEKASFKRSLLDEKPMMEAQSMKANVGLKRKRETDNGSKKADPKRMKQKIPSVQRREKTVVESRQTKGNISLKRQRKMDRKASRIAMEKMQNTAGIEMNVKIVEELNILSGFSLSTVDVLESLGLFLKDECMEFEEEIEDGEITCTTITYIASKTQHDINVVRDNNGEKIDPEKIKSEEKEKCQRRLLDEKAMIDAELKSQREMDRYAARIALEKMENTAGMEINVEIERELYILIGVSHSTGDSLYYV